MCPARQAHRRERQSVFVSFWMSHSTNEPELPEMLTSRLLGRANVITGRDLVGSPQYTSEIRSLMRERADAVVVDLSALRRDECVEYGWAVGLSKPVILACSDSTQRQGCPEWLRQRQIHLYGGDRLNEFVSHVIEVLDTPADSLTRWQLDPTGHSLTRRTETARTLIIGGGQHWEETIAQLGAANKEHGYGALTTILLDDALTRGDRVFEIIRNARQAARMILVFTGSEDVDYLSCLAGGVFSARDQFGKQRYQRHLLLLNLSGQPDRDIIPKLLSTKPGVELTKDIPKAAAQLRMHLRDQ